MTNRILPILLAAAFILGGCLGQGDEPEPDGEDQENNKGKGSDDSGGGGQGSGGEDGPGDGNDGEGDDLEALLTANITVGEAPLYVNFTLNVSGAEGDVAWELDLGDNSTQEGEALPATVEHTYEETGNHTVILTVTQEARDGTTNLTISVEGPTEPQPNDIQQGDNSDCLDAIVLYQVSGVESPDAVRVEVDPETRWEGTASSGRMTVDFFRANDSHIDNVREGGIVPEDAAYGLICIRADSDPTPEDGASWTYQDGLPPEEE